MRRIYVGDGGSFVWQWQPKEQIALEGYPDGVFVRYANCDTVEAPVVQTRREGDKLVADIPPELMQVDKDITVYVCNEDGIIHCHFLSVISSPKPSSYVYEPVEVLRYDSLAAKIPFNDSYSGKLLYVVDGVARPLELGPGLEIRDGVLYVTGATEPEKPLGVVTTDVVDGDFRVYLDGVEIVPVLDEAGDMTWPGLTIAVDSSGNATLKGGTT